jgi:hypothetical protein
MPSFNVYLPDALAERYRAAKEELNLSALLQEAVSRELRKIEQRAKDVPAIEEHVDLERLVSRIRRQREALYRVGWEVALDWVGDAPYHELRYLGQEQVGWDSYRDENRDFREDNSVLNQQMEEAQARAGDRQLPWDPEQAQAGFLAAVEETWRLLEPEPAQPTAIPDLPVSREDDDIPF